MHIIYLGPKESTDFLLIIATASTTTHWSTRRQISVELTNKPNVGGYVLRHVSECAPLCPRIISSLSKCLKTKGSIYIVCVLGVYSHVGLLSNLWEWKQ